VWAVGMLVYNCAKNLSKENIPKGKTGMFDIVHKITSGMCKGQDLDQSAELKDFVDMCLRMNSAEVSRLSSSSSSSSSCFPQKQRRMTSGNHIIASLFGRTAAAPLPRFSAQDLSLQPLLDRPLSCSLKKSKKVEG